MGCALLDSSLHSAALRFVQNDKPILVILSEAKNPAKVRSTLICTKTERRWQKQRSADFQTY